MQTTTKIFGNTFLFTDGWKWKCCQSRQWRKMVTLIINIHGNCFKKPTPSGVCSPPSRMPLSSVAPELHHAELKNSSSDPKDHLLSSWGPPSYPPPQSSSSVWGKLIWISQLCIICFVPILKRGGPSQWANLGLQAVKLNQYWYLLYFHVQVDFVNGPFVALDHIFDLAPSDRFLNFSFPSYGCFREGDPQNGDS